jgi:O-antigen/teichoic acid export membrane protein
MRIDKEQRRFSQSSADFRLPAASLVGKLLAFAAGATLLVVAVSVSLLVFAVALAGGLLAWSYLWWKTRELRKQMRERRSGGRVIRGSVIRDVGSDDGIQR